jgi:hypothetical protein
MLSAPQIIPATSSPPSPPAFAPAPGRDRNIFADQCEEGDPFGQAHDRNQPGLRHEIRVIEPR